MVEQILTTLVIFAAPIPWWLILLHTVSKQKSKFAGIFAYLSVGFAWLILGYFFFSINILFSNKLETGIFSISVGIISLISAIVIDWNVMSTLGLKRLVCIAEVKGSSNALVTKGIYKYSRHPRYVEYPLLSLGFGLVYGYSSLMWFALYLFIAFWITTYFEESELVHRFGKAYVNYQKKVPRYFIRL